jgi:uncharacterized protein (DUF433 family)
VNTVKTLAQLQEAILRLTPEEQAELRRWMQAQSGGLMVRDPQAAYAPALELAPGMPSMAEAVPLRTDEDGVVRMRGSRIRLDTVITAFHLGSAPEEIVDKFPTLKVADVYQVIAYYLTHMAEVDAYLAVREKEAEVLRREVEARWSPIGLRERLLARKAAKAKTGD